MRVDERGHTYVAGLRSHVQRSDAVMIRRAHRCTSTLEQEAHGLQVPAPRGDVEWALALVSGGVDQCPVGDESSQHFGLAMPYCCMERQITS